MSKARSIKTSNLTLDWYVYQEISVKFKPANCVTHIWVAPNMADRWIGSRGNPLCSVWGLSVGNTWPTNPWSGNMATDACAITMQNIWHAGCWPFHWDCTLDMGHIGHWDTWTLGHIGHLAILRNFPAAVRFPQHFAAANCRNVAPLAAWCNAALAHLQRMPTS